MTVSDFTKTPSYFNNTETFEKYLGQTSYYLGLQQAVKKIVALTAPKKVVELGSATGATTVMLASEFPKIKFVGCDIREDVTHIARDAAKEKALANAEFIAEDMCRTVEKPIDAELVVLLYSFHHILDPLEKKIKFLTDAYSNMRKNSFLCIAETFIPECAKDNADSESILELWNVRKDEGGASTFWKALRSLDGEGIAHARSVAEYCKDNEFFAGELVADRRDEYLVKRSWLDEKGRAAGFATVLNEPVNNIGDGVVLFEKC